MYIDLHTSGINVWEFYYRIQEFSPRVDLGLDIRLKTILDNGANILVVPKFQYLLISSVKLQQKN